MSKKRTILLIKIKTPNEKMKVIEAVKKDGWSNKDIRKFIDGIERAYPEVTVTTSTISQ